MEDKARVTVFKKRGGTPKIGQRRVVKIALPEAEWRDIENMIDTGKYESYSQYFREAHRNYQK